MAVKWSDVFAPAIEILKDQPRIDEWKVAVGHVIVAFGALERAMLDWAIILSGDEEMLRRHHKDDMKAIAPAVRRVVKKLKTHFPEREFAFAMGLIERAEKLIQDRNDVAHAWFTRSGNMTTGKISLLVAKRDQRTKLVFGVRDLGWVKECGRKIDKALSDCRTIRRGTIAYIPEARERLRLRGE